MILFAEQCGHHFCPPFPIDTMAAPIFRPPGRYIEEDSSVTLLLDIATDQTFYFQNKNFIGGPDGAAKIAEERNGYLIIEELKQYDVFEGDWACDYFYPHMFIVNAEDSSYRIDIINTTRRYITDRYPMRFKNGILEMYHTRYFMFLKRCTLYSTYSWSYNIPNPEIRSTMGEKDTVVFQITTMSFKIRD